jgi:KTSC domain-containing protein
MPRVRDYRAEYARRQARAREAGYGGYYEQERERRLRLAGLTPAQIAREPAYRVRRARRTPGEIQEAVLRQEVEGRTYLADYPQLDPTPTTNPPRPRTLQAGYDPQSRVLRVTFRDGTLWEYYEVPAQVWENFETTESPGRFINRVLNYYPYGPAGVG